MGRLVSGTSANFRPLGGCLELAPRHTRVLRWRAASSCPEARENHFLSPWGWVRVSPECPGMWRRGLASTATRFGYTRDSA